MSDQPIYARMGDAIQRHSDAVLDLQAVAEEFSEFAARLRSMHDRLQKSLQSGLDAPGVMRLPRGILPEKREAESA